MTTSDLHFSVSLDDQKVPVSIQWHASDPAADTPAEQTAHAVNISIWNKDEAGTMRVSLWTKDMPIDQLKRFYLDTIGALAEDLNRATDDAAMSEKISALCSELLQELN